MLPVISVNALSDGLLLINGAMAGDVGQEQWVNLPVTPTGRCYLHFLSAHPKWDNCGCRLDFEAGRLQPPGEDFPGEITLWSTGVCEITLSPREARSAAPPPLAPEVLARLTLAAGEASLLRYGGLWALLEDPQGRVELSEPLPPEAVSGELFALGEGFFARGDCASGGQWCAVFAPREGRWQRTLYARGDTVTREKDAFVAAAALGDAADHRLITRFYPRGEEWHAEKEIRALGEVPSDPQAVAHAFVQACVLQEYAEARRYLCAALRTQLSAGQLKGFMGPAESCGTARYAPPPAPKEAAWTLFTRAGSHLLQARTLYFSFLREENALRIEDIRPE